MAQSILELDRDGFVVLPRVFSDVDVAEILSAWSAALGKVDADDGPLRSRAGGLYGARNVVRLWPEVVDVWRRSALVDALSTALGPDFGLVRVLFFDKPPEQSWSLPWHKDLTIAVRNNRLPSTHFCKPTTKAGVPHVEAPQALLERMLTARIHLDEVTSENGPLQVVPGSHQTGKLPFAGDAAPQSILCAAGEVLLMRPLLAHCSGHSIPDTARHRRILHLEFAADPDLPDGYAWHSWIPFNTQNA